MEKSSHAPSARDLWSSVFTCRPLMRLGRFVRLLLEEGRRRTRRGVRVRRLPGGGRLWPCPL